MISFIRGDFRFFWPENIGNFAHLPSGWDSILNTGLGTSSIASLWITSYLNFTALFSNIGLSWNAISIIFWFVPVIVLSFLSAFLLFIYLFPGKKYFGLFAGFFYIFNTYFLLIFEGGQMGVAFAYSLAPFVLLTFLKLFSNLQLRNSILFGFIFSLQFLFDPRIVYITIFVVGIYWLFHFSLQNFRNQLLYIIVIPGLLTLFLHEFWILPLILTHGSSIPRGLLSAPSLSFFSFADFSHALSLLHPNWPENIFGKVYFLQPEFLLLPIFAFGSLLFLNVREIKQKQIVLVFALLGLLGAFLAKGVNPPFGQIYSFLFTYIPGFQLFRDPTKWYILIAISYTILIPYNISHIYTFIQKKILFKNKFLDTYAATIFLACVVLYFLFLLRPLFASSNRLFRPEHVPHDYVQLKDLLVKQKVFSRTLWIPTWQRYGFFSEKHPAIGRYELLHSVSAKKQIQALQHPETQTLLQEAAVKYIIVPYDSEGEIFVKDHRYNEKEYQQTVHSLENISWLKKIDGFDKLAVFEVPDPLDHFFVITQQNKILPISYKQISETQYTLNTSHLKKGDTIIFSESYDPGWVLQNAQTTIHGRQYKIFNSFVLNTNGNKNASIFYQPQQWVNVGLVISLITIILMCGLLVFEIVS